MAFVVGGDNKTVGANGKKRATQYRTLSGWSRNSLEKGSPAYEREVIRLQAQLDSSATEMMNFTEQMSEWVDASTAEGKLRKFNQMYCTKMINDCLLPLNEGLSADAVVETIGLYIGMSLFSKDFRDRCNSAVANALMPYVKDRALKNAEKVDRRMDRLQKMSDGLGLGLNFVMRDSNGNPVSRSEITEYKLNERWKEIRAKATGGREAITPESAATKYLGFCKQAYDMMRTDTNDMKTLREDIEKAEALGETSRVKEQTEKLREMETERNSRVMHSFNVATNTLFKVAAMDGVDSDDIQHYAMSIYGRVSEKNPEFEKIFSQTALSQLRKKTEMHFDSNGQPFEVWNGEFVDEGGVPFKGMLSPRKPMHRDECVDKIGFELRRLFDAVGDADLIREACRRGRMNKVEGYFKGIISDDLFPASSMDAAQHETVVQDFYNRVFERSLDKWIDMNMEPQRRAEEEARRAAEQERAETRRVEREERDRLREQRDAAREKREQEAHDAYMDVLNKIKASYDNPNSKAARAAMNVIPTPPSGPARPTKKPGQSSKNWNDSPQNKSGHYGKSARHKLNTKKQEHASGAEAKDVSSRSEEQEMSI